MHEILIISGKGGTGKTSLTASFAHLAHRPLICDLDVDAPDLHLLLQPVNTESREFWSGHTAVIDSDKCSGCGLCRELCRYGAIMAPGGEPRIDPLRCEGCKVCVVLCPEQAVSFVPSRCGTWYESQTRFGPMVHAQLFPGEENSGRLVALLRQHARELAKQKGLDVILSDGPPGIGCPVISSLSGTHLAVVVTEPTPSGRHDLLRVVGLCEHFNIPTAVLINKWDLNPFVSKEIEQICAQKSVATIGRLAHHPAFTQAMVQGRTITEFGTETVATEIRRAWQRIIDLAGLEPQTDAKTA